MKLEKLLEKMEYRLIRGDLSTEISGVVYDSRKVTEGSAFICIVGAKFDAHEKIDEVAEMGAACVFVRSDRVREGYPEGLTVIAVDDTRIALAYAAAAWFDYPAEKIPVIGITGTKGKTTTTYMVKSILDHAGQKTGLIGTIEAIIGDTHIHAVNTTPESYVVQQYLHDMIEAGCTCCVMEVSSQALMLGRCAGIEFEIGVFTNLSPDHIGPNEHKDFEDYLRCKSLLFRQCRHGIINADDKYAEEILKGHTCSVETYGIDNPDADIRAVNIQHVSILCLQCADCNIYLQTLPNRDQRYSESSESGKGQGQDRDGESI